MTDAEPSKPLEDRLSDSETRFDLERQVAERTAELQASRDLLQATMDASTDMIQVFEAVRNNDGEIVDFRWLLNNHISESRYGEVRGQSLLERNPGVIQEGIFEAFRQVVQTGRPRQDERHYVHEQFDGWFLQSVVKLNDGVATTTKDITAWKRSQEELLFLRDEKAQAQVREIEKRALAVSEAARSQLIATLESIGDAFYAVDATFRLTYVNAKAEAMWARPRETLIGRNIWSEFPKALGGDHHLQHLAVMRERRSIQYEGFSPILGRWMEASLYPDPVSGGLSCYFRDITDRRRTEAALHASEERQRLTVELVPALLWTADPTGLDIGAMDRWKLYTGQSEAAVQGYGWLDAIHPDDREATRAAFVQAFATGEPIERQQRIHQAGNGYRWHLVRHVPVRDGSGAVVRWFGAAIDVHELHQLQDRQQVLVAELQHRTRNLMGVVQAMFEDTLRSTGELDAFAADYRDRLRALGRVQGLLSRLNNGDRVTFDVLIRDEMRAVGAPSESGKVTLEGPAGVALRSSTVQTFALAIHELATNALKYGALKQPGARLAVTWRLAPAGPYGRPWLHVDWIESGVAMPPDDSAPQGTGQGRQLIEHALPYQLGAITTYVRAPDGVRCSIAVPVSSRTAAEETNDDHTHAP